MYSNYYGIKMKLQLLKAYWILKKSHSATVESSWLSISARNILRFYCVFWVFSNITDDHSYLWGAVSPQNIHRLCLQVVYTFWNINIPNVTSGYGRFSKCNFRLWKFFFYLIAFFFGIFHIFLHVWNVMTSWLQTFTNYVLRQKLYLAKKIWNFVSLIEFKQRCQWQETKEKIKCCGNFSHA